MGITLDEILIDASTSSIAISDGVDTMGVNADGSINAIVSATDLDIRDLTHVSDSVKVGDGNDFLAVNADGSINVTQAASQTQKTSQASVTTTAAEVLAVPLANRKQVIIQNEGTANVYVGSTSGVTAANGIKISKASSASLDFGANVDIFMIAASGTQDVRFLEIA